MTGELGMKVKILLVDDHPMLRRGMSQAMAEQPHLALVSEISNASEAVRLAEELKPDLIVMDLHLPDLNGIEATRKILNVQPAIKIIIFSSSATRSEVDNALQAGASGYVIKSGEVADLFHAIDRVMAGKLYLSPEVAQAVLEHYRNNLREEFEQSRPLLSKREKHLLQFVAEGRRNKEIAAQFAISIKTVEASRSRLMKKLGCSSSAELVRYAIREGIVAA